MSMQPADSTWAPPPIQRDWTVAARPAYSPFSILGWLAAGHVVLALTLDQSKWIATGVALGVLGVGLVLAARPRTAHYAIYVAGYLATADVLWRMTKARVFWEYGKYSVILLLLVIAVARGARRGFAELAALYFAFFVPSAFFTLQALGLTHELRKALSFNLSGPFCLAICVAFFSAMPRVQEIDLTRLLTSMLMPIIGVFSLAAYSTLTATTLEFGNEANFVTSGGFGPNQVSAILGLGVLILLILAFNATDVRLRLAAMGLAGALQLQSFLTFSRGGTFNVIVAVTLMGMHYLRDRRSRRIFVTAMAIVAAVGVFVVLPQLDSLTAGNLSERFTSFDTTGRRALAESDLSIFEENPIFGVGPGLAQYSREDIRQYGIAPHTEFTRVLAEHGAFGLVGVGVLLLIAWQAYRVAPTSLSKGWVIGFVAWSMAEMTHSAMRIVAISFIFGMACLPFHRWGQSGN